MNEHDCFTARGFTYSRVEISNNCDILFWQLFIICKNCLYHVLYLFFLQFSAKNHVLSFRFLRVVEVVMRYIHFSIIFSGFKIAPKGKYTRYLTKFVQNIILYALEGLSDPSKTLFKNLCKKVAFLGTWSIMSTSLT